MSSYQKGTRIMAVLQQNEWRMYVGTYTRREPHVVGKSEGIHSYRFNADSGTLSYESVTTGVANPSFLTIDPSGTRLYSIFEVEEVDGNKGGAVGAFEIDDESGELRLLNQQSTIGPGPCHVCVDATGQLAMVANYAGGSVAAFPIEGDGVLAPASEFIQHEGSSVNPQRQSEPHAHSVTVDPTNRYLFAADLGLDKILVYEMDLKAGRLRPNHAQPWARTKAGAGPRHFAFHPSGNFAFVINEIDSTITAFEYHSDKGTLRELTAISTLPEDFQGTSWCADIHVHPSGRYVYGSNRGHDSIVVMGFNERSGELHVIGHTSTQGKVPRNFTLDPTGNFLLVANQNSDNIVVLAIDSKSGKLSQTGVEVEAPTPVCIKFVPKR
jgi:6-phosphogluconolactonase